MLFNPVNNKIALSIYNILWEVFIGFGTFIIFFGIFIKYYFNELEDNLMKNYINNSISFYKPLFSKINQTNIFKDNINKIVNVNQLNIEVNQKEEEVKQYNMKYDNLLIKIINYILIGFIVLLLLPILLGIIPLEYVNLKYISISFIVHLVLVSIFELILLNIIIPINNPIEIYTLFNGILDVSNTTTNN
jgi:large-conductance mechanosensitive channel